MRRLALAFTCAFVGLALQITGAQTPIRRAPVARAASPAEQLPVRRVILYKNGVGYFEHVGRIRGNQNVTIDFNSSQLNDVLKTLTVLDLGSGRVTGISYNSEAPMAQRLGGLRLSLGEHATRAQLLDALRGSRVEVRAAGRSFVGRLLGVEAKERTHNGDTSTTDELTLVADNGELRVVEITPAVDVRLVERESASQVDAFLTLLASANAPDRRRMTIATAGTGQRDLLVGYVSEVPVWKTTYRIVLPAAAGSALLQGWAIVDNTIGEDWRDVEMSLVAGAPQSFVQQLSQPLYAQRPVVALPRSLSPAPQTHAATLENGVGRLSGRATDEAGGVLPGVSVRALDPAGRLVRTAVTSADGRFAIDGVPPGRYSIVFELAGFQTSRLDDVVVDAATTVEQNAVLSIASMAESVTVAGQQPTLGGPMAGPVAAPRSVGVVGRGSGGGVGTGAGTGVGGGVVGGVTGGIVGGLAAAPPPTTIADKIAELQPAAQGGDLGDLFQYKIEGPISIQKNHSALVPILRSDVKVERVSLWNARRDRARPLRSLWLTNATGLTLDGGSFTVLDAGAFAGEGLVEPLKPGEKRLLSYAVDLGVQVEPRNGDERRTVTRMSIAHGVLVEHTEHVARRVYTIRNSDTTERRVVIEHPVRAGWKLAAGVSPVETSAEAYRFVTTVAPAKTETLTVVEQQPLDTRYAVSTITDQQIEMFVRESGSDGGLQSALAPMLAARKAVAAIQADLIKHADETGRIGNDQNRVRENMKALKGSSEEQQLLKRYTVQLAQQEDRIDALRRESDELERRLAEAQNMLSREIEALSADITVKPTTQQ